MDMIFGSMGAPDYFNHKSDRERKIETGEVVDSDVDDENDNSLEYDDSDTDDFVVKVPFSSRTKNQFTPNAEAFRDHLKGRQSLPAGALAPRPNIKLEASGTLTLLQTFDFNDIYEQLGRPKRSETFLSIMSCQYSPKKEYIALALSTGEIEVLQYDERSGSVRICYTLLDKDVNKECVNCTTLCWMPDGRRIIAGYTNGFLKLWHVTSKTALVSRNENTFADRFDDINEHDVVNEVFNRRTRSSKTSNDKRQIHCVDYSRRQVSVDLSRFLDPDKPRSTDSLNLEGRKTREDKVEGDRMRRVNLVASGGSDGNVIVWFLFEPKTTFPDKNNPKLVGRQLFFNCACVHSGTKTAMDGHVMNIFAVRFSPKEPTHFFSGGWDSIIFKWDALSGQCLSTIKGPLTCSNDSMNMDLETNLAIFLCADHSSGYIDLIDYSDPERMAVDTRLLMPSERFVMPYACCFFGTDKIIIGGSNPNCLRIIDRKLQYSSSDQQAGELTNPNSAQQPGGANSAGVEKHNEANYPTVNKQGVATVFGSVDDLPAGVSSVDLGPEDKLKKQVITACAGSMILFLNSTVRH